MPIPQDLLEILACPACKSNLRVEADELVCAACGRRYAVRDGIPILLIEEGDRGLAAFKARPGA
jgi:uncharacterized protein YbaR (Trm112 family)